MHAHSALPELKSHRKKYLRVVVVVVVVVAVVVVVVAVVIVIEAKPRLFLLLRTTKSKT